MLENEKHGHSTLTFFSTVSFSPAILDCPEKKFIKILSEDMSIHFSTNTISVGDTVDNTVSFNVTDTDLAIEHHNSAANIRVNDIILENFAHLPVTDKVDILSRLNDIEARLAVLEAMT